MAVYKIDSLRGDDGNAGTEAAPWASWSKLAGAFAAGDTILIADDSSFELSPLYANNVTVTSDGTQAAPITICREGKLPGVYPQLTRNYTIPTGEWTWDAGNGAWYFDALSVLGVPAIQTYDLLLLGSGRTYATRRASAAACTADGYWYNDTTNKRVYLYAPPGQTPTAYYGAVVYGAAGLSCLHTNNSPWLTVAGLAAYDSGALLLTYTSGTPADHEIVVRDCRTTRMGCAVRTTAGHTSGDMTFRVYGLVSDQTAGHTVHAYATSYAGIRLICARSDLRRANMSSSTGGAVKLQTYARSGLWNEVVDNYIETVPFAIENPEDGAGVYTETGCRNTLVARNVFQNMALPMQDNSGYPTKWISNLAIDCDRLICSTDGAGGGNGHATLYNNTLIGLIDQYGTTTRGEGSPIYVANSVNLDARNNALWTGEPAGTTLPILNITNAASDVIEATNAVVGYKTDTFVEGAGNVALTAPVTSVEWAESYRPLVGSQLLTAGTDLGYVRDLDGKQSRKHIGAYGAARLRET